MRSATLLSAFEKYIHAGDDLPPLVRAGLLHVQFETIHPYLDGNGRIGRLLVTLLLEHWKLLTKPLLYLSLFFKRHRSDYYDRLGAVRTSGDWEGWTDFFLDGVATIADEAVTSARELFTLVTRRSITRPRSRRHLGRGGASLRAPATASRSSRSPSPSSSSGSASPRPGAPSRPWRRAGVLVETTGKKRDRSWGYQRYLDKLRVGTELEAPGRP